MCQRARDSERFRSDPRTTSVAWSPYAADTPFGIYSASYNIIATENGPRREIQTRVDINAQLRSAGARFTGNIVLSFDNLYANTTARCPHSIRYGDRMTHIG